MMGVVDYIVLSRIMFLAVLEISYGMVDIQQYGYLCMRFEVFAAYFADCAKEIHEYLDALSPGLAVPDFDGFMKRLCRGETYPWPPRPHPIIHRSGEAIYLDVVSATLQLRDSLEFPPLQGAVANIRSEHFEIAVQELIDASRWAPPKELRDYRGRTLKLSKKALTDIDAIGSLEGTLLAVSCKSAPYTRAYDRGVYNIIRNAATLVAKAAQDWARVRETLAAQPRGDNYDFSEYTKVVGVVITPFAVYALDTSTRAEPLPGLRAVSSIEEFRKWLKGGQ